MTKPDDRLQTTLVIGASGGIGSAVARALISARVEDTDQHVEVPATRRIITISRQPNAPCEGVSRHVQSDHSEAEIAAACADIVANEGNLSRVIICNGILHGEGVRPERSLKQVDGIAMAKVLQANTIVPMLWLSGLFEGLKRAQAPRVGVLSARVGSIGDNGLGGWYSYRGSKAALNMMLQCAAIELHRVNRKAALMAFHPGTTDTALSKPFQKGVPAGKLFTPDFVAERLLRELEKTPATGQLNYVDWDGKAIPW